MLNITKFEKVKFQLQLKTFYSDYLTIDKKGKKYILNEVFTSEPIKTYLMLGATQKPIYTYPNTSYGYGILNYQNTLQRISENL